jgi:hypothetical protein
MNTIKKKIKLKEDSGNYVTKITLGDKGDIDSMKVRRTVGGFLRGAPRVSKAEAQAQAEAKPKAKTGKLIPKKSSVSKKITSAKKSIGNKSMKRK